MFVFFALESKQDDSSFWSEKQEFSNLTENTI
jgi:hypothetical protein